MRSRLWLAGVVARGRSFMRLWLGGCRIWVVRKQDKSERRYGRE
jgi:hypothetical protein